MNIVKNYKNLQLIIDDNLLESMYQSSLEYYPNEYGGFLIGSYSSDYKKLYIEYSITAKFYNSNQATFVRESDYLKSEFESLFLNKGVYYVGEWHTHPNSQAWYSSTDLRAMINIRNESDVKINNPILLVLSTTKDSLKDFNFFILINDRLEVYE